MVDMTLTTYIQDDCVRQFPLEVISRILQEVTILSKSLNLRSLEISCVL